MLVNVFRKQGCKGKVFFFNRGHLELRPEFPIEASMHAGRKLKSQKRRLRRILKMIGLRKQDFECKSKSMKSQQRRLRDAERKRVKYGFHNPE